MDAEHETNVRGLVLLGCLVTGLALMIPAAWLANAGLSRVEWSPLLESLIALIIAFAPMVAIFRYAARKLDARYPDSPSRRIPEPHERASAHRKTGLAPRGK